MGLRTKLSSLTKRGFASKLNATAAQAVVRLPELKKLHQERAGIACSDVVQLLEIGSNERALFRVDQVIKEQNVYEVIVVLEAYCYLLMERIKLFEQEKLFPEELKEAVSTLIFAAARIGEFPEFTKIQSLFAHRYGKEFALRAIELRNNCGVDPKIVRMLSTRMSSLEKRMSMLRKIAAENNIHLPIDGTTSYTEVETDKKIGEIESVENRDIHNNDTGGGNAMKKMIQEDENMKGASDQVEESIRSQIPEPMNINKRPICLRNKSSYF